MEKLRELLELIHQDANNDYKCNISVFKNWIVGYDDNQNEIFKQTEKLMNFDSFMNQITYDISTQASDVFFSINSFRHSKRKSDDVWHLNAFALDFDFYKIKDYRNLDPIEFYELIESELPFEPTAVISSGRGLYVIFCFEHASRACSNLYKAIYKNFLNKFAKYGLDSKAMNITQLIRVPYTINSKTNEFVDILKLNKNIYKLEDFAKLLPYKNKEYKKVINSKNSNKKINLKNQKTHRRNFLNKLINDFKTLIKLRNESNNLEGYRELLIFIIRKRCSWADLSIDDELAIANELNDLFEKPLTTKEVVNVCKPCGSTRAYNIETIINKLEITQEEMKKMKLLVNNSLRISNLISKKRTHKLLNKTQKEIDLRKRRLQVCALKNKGLTNTNIAKELNINKSTVTRDLRYIKKHAYAFIKKLEENFEELNKDRDNNDIFKDFELAKSCIRRLIE